MRPIKKGKLLALATALTFSAIGGLSSAAMGQSSNIPPANPGSQDTASKQRPRTADKKSATIGATSEGMEPDEKTKTPSDIPQDTQANRQEQMSEENAVVPYYNNFFSTYRLGPEDVISVTVFGQDRYSKSGITIPPSGRISLALIPGGLFVNGKTTEEVEGLIKKRYDEYIIDPQVTVSLDKAASYRYSILGDVAQPGVKLMSHRMTVTEAIAEAGGVLPTGNRSKVMVLRHQQNGTMAQIPVNVSAIYKGREPDSTYLISGDQILVPGNKLKSFQKILGLVQVASFARIFTGGW
jgi:protein involved in polysaccharide export with SLBB domain